MSSTTQIMAWVQLRSQEDRSSWREWRQQWGPHDPHQVLVFQQWHGRFCTSLHSLAHGLDDDICAIWKVQIRFCSYEVLIQSVLWWNKRDDVICWRFHLPPSLSVSKLTLIHAFWLKHRYIIVCWSNVLRYGILWWRWLIPIGICAQFLEFPGAKVGFVNSLKFVSESPHGPVPCYRVLDDHGQEIENTQMPEVRYALLPLSPDTIWISTGVDDW